MEVSHVHGRVETVEWITPKMVRIVLGGDGLDGFTAGEFSDHYVKLLFPPPDAPYRVPFDARQIQEALPREQWPSLRTYSVRHWDPDATLLTIDFVVHSDTGIAGPWAANARPGDEIQFRGPGGTYTPDPDADWHLMVGDESVLPAIAASLARIAEGVPVYVLVEVYDADDELPLDCPGELHVSWLHRSKNPAESELLLAAVRGLEFPGGAVHGFVHGEAGAVRAVRRHLLAERRVPRGALSMSGYWRRAMTEDGWQSSKREWNAQVERDVTD